MEQPTDKGRRPVSWSVAVFAYNEAGRIRHSLESIEAAAAGHALNITVLANGCTDATGDAVRAFAKDRDHIRLVEIGLADKANAWNVYVHDSLTSGRCTEISTHFFVDGDVRVERHAFPALASALDQVESANAAGGMPTTGRDRDAWRARMVARGTLSGGLYALRGSFVGRIRAQHVRIPSGFIGEDWLVSFLAGTNLGADRSTDPARFVVFSPEAGFSFRSLDPLVPRDYRTYLRRLWRYTLRDVQFEMLMNLLRREGLTAMPRDVEGLYRRSLPPSRLKWVGRRTALRLLAVQRVRAIRAQAVQDQD